jgi:hypothetical protein
MWKNSVAAVRVERQARAQWPILAQWIAEVLVPWYEITCDELPDCWPLHRPALVELSWLRSAHVQAYLRSSAPSVEGEWHPALAPRRSRTPQQGDRPAPLPPQRAPRPRGPIPTADTAAPTCPTRRNISIADPRPLTLPKQTAGVDAVVADQANENDPLAYTDGWDSDVTVVSPKMIGGGQTLSRAPAPRRAPSRARHGERAAVGVGWTGRRPAGRPARPTATHGRSSRAAASPGSDRLRSHPPGCGGLAVDGSCQA